MIFYDPFLKGVQEGSYIFCCQDPHIFLVVLKIAWGLGKRCGSLGKTPPPLLTSFPWPGGTIFSPTRWRWLSTVCHYVVSLVVALASVRRGNTLQAGQCQESDEGSVWIRGEPSEGEVVELFPLIFLLFPRAGLQTFGGARRRWRQV